MTFATCSRGHVRSSAAGRRHMTVSGSRTVATIATLALILIPTLAQKGPRAAVASGPIRGDGPRNPRRPERAGLRHQRSRASGRVRDDRRVPGARIPLGQRSDDRPSNAGRPSQRRQAINIFGHVVGNALVTANSESRAVLWKNGAITDLTPGVQAARPRPSTTRARSSAPATTGQHSSGRTA